MKKILIPFVLFFLISGVRADGINFIFPDNVKKKKYLYVFPFFTGPGVWDQYLINNIGKISSASLKWIIERDQNRGFFKKFPLKIRRGKIFYWKLKKQGIDLFCYNFDHLNRIAKSIGRKKSLFLFPKLKLYKFDRKNHVALLKVFFYLLNDEGKIVARHRVKIVVKDGDFDRAFEEVEESRIAKNEAIPPKYSIVISLTSRALMEFFQWIEGYF